jgi:hypothetical protein
VHNSSFGRSYDYVGGIGALQQADPDRYESLHLEEFDRPPRLVSYLGPSATDSFALKWNMAMAHPQGHPIVAAVAQHLKVARPRTRRLPHCGKGITVRSAPRRGSTDRRVSVRREEQTR